MDRQAYLYAPESFDADWPAQLLGTVLKPAVDATTPEWFWFTFYTPDWDRDPTNHGIPPSHRWADGRGRFVNVRYSAKRAEIFEAKLAEMKQQVGHEDFYDDYDVVRDLGDDRYVSSARAATDGDPIALREERARLFRNLLHASGVLALHGLMQVEAGEWAFERNDHPHLHGAGSFVQRIAHLASNMNGNQMVAVVRDRATGIGLPP